MAMYTTLRRGSKGDDVKKLQEGLIGAGYDLGASGADGIYGDKTMKAVQQYQQANGLAVDGVAGENTLGKLYASTTNAATTPPKATTPQTATEWVKYYEDKLPGQYTSGWQEQIDALYDKVQSQPAFQYDFVSDPMYQHYADRFQQMGQRSMRDTMGQAAALTGGYGNSYAQMVGQQAYDQQLEGMNDIIPQLRSMAYEQYQNERAADIDALGLLLDREGQDYDRWRDQQRDYADMRDYWYGKALDEAALAAAGRGGGGGSGSGKGNDTPNYYDDGSMLYDNARERVLTAWQNSGKDSAYATINALLQDGKISQHQASALRDYIKGRGNGSVAGRGGSGISKSNINVQEVM